MKPARFGIRFALSLSLPISLAWLACGGTVGETLRPQDDQTGSKVLNEKAPVCTGVAKSACPYVVDLDSDTRVELEAAMGKGVAVVAYDCASLRVLSQCTLPESAYAYAGVSRKEQV